MAYTGSTVAGLESGCKSLFKAACVDLYRNNVFRITGLPVDASAKDIAKHADRLKMMQELGHGRTAHTFAYALDPPPSVDQIRDAMQKLREPEERLVDEFFWFWPHEYGASSSDPALQALKKGERSEAYQLWSQGEADSANGFIAAHNIAVMYHIIALDWTHYHFASDLDADREEKIRGYWTAAFQRWEILATDDRVWDWVKARIRAFDDPRLTTGFARRMEAALPDALDKINAEVALTFAEQGRNDWARTHVTFMRDTHRGLGDIDKVAELVLAQTRKRVLHHIKVANDDADRQPTKGAEAAQHLLDHCRPLLQLFELFHTQDAHQRNELFDEVAEAIISCVVGFQKAVGDNATFVALLQAALAFATSEDVRARIDKNIEIGEHNIASTALEPLLSQLKSIHSSSHPPKTKLARIQAAMMPELAALIHAEGDKSKVVHIFANQICATLRGISVDAYNEYDDLDTASAACALASNICRDDDLKRQLQTDKDQLSKLRIAEEKNNLRLTIRQDVVEVTSHHVHYAGHVIAGQDVAGVRFGVFRQFTNGIQSSCSYHVGVLSSKGGSLNIECKRFFRSEQQAHADFQAIVSSLYSQIIPQLVIRVAKAVVSGREQKVGTFVLTANGIQVTTGALMWKKNHVIPYGRIAFNFGAGVLEVQSADDKSIKASQDVRDVWNAVICQQLAETIVALKKEILNPKADERARMSKSPTDPDTSTRNVFDIAPAQYPDERKLVPLLAEELAKMRNKHDGATPDIDLTAFARSIAIIATNAWRAKGRMIDPTTGEVKDDLKRICRHIESILESLVEMGIEIKDRTGEPFDYGLPEKVITTQPKEGISKEHVLETIKPTVYWKAHIIQHGEVVIAAPIKPGA